MAERSQQCEHRMWRDWHHIQCSRLGTVVAKNGKPYCRQHDPDVKEAKAAAWDAKYRAEREREKQIQADAKALIQELGCGVYSGGAISMDLNEARALINRLRGMTGTEIGR